MSRSPGHCPAGHALSSGPWTPTLGSSLASLFCDGCRGDIHAGEQAHRCQACATDFCTRCVPGGAAGEVVLPKGRRRSVFELALAGDVAIGGTGTANRAWLACPDGHNLSAFVVTAGDAAVACGSCGFVADAAAPSHTGTDSTGIGAATPHQSGGVVVMLGCVSCDVDRTVCLDCGAAGKRVKGGERGEEGKGDGDEQQKGGDGGEGTARRGDAADGSRGENKGDTTSAASTTTSDAAATTAAATAAGGSPPFDAETKEHIMEQVAKEVTKEMNAPFKLWISAETQTTMRLADHHAAHCLLEDLHSVRAVTEGGRLCVYFRTQDHLDQAARRVGELKAIEEAGYGGDEGEGGAGQVQAQGQEENGGVSTSVTSAASEGKEAHLMRPSEPYADPSSPSRAGAVGVVRNGGMDHPEDRHRLWVSKDTQHFCDMENHDHAHEMLVLETLRSTHAVSHQTNGKICIYFKTDDEMSEAIEWIKKKKKENTPVHIARGCDYPACYRARMKTSGGPTVVSRSVAAMSTVFSTVAGGTFVLLVSNSTQHIIGLHAGNADVVLEGMGVEGTAMDATTGRIAVSFKDSQSMDAAEQWMKARKSEELAVHVAEGCNFPYCAQTRLAMNEVTETQGWGQGYNIATSSTKMTAVKEEVISLQQGTMFDLTLSHEACDDDEYLVTDVVAPVGVCIASKNVLTYTPPFDYIGRVVVTYKTTAKGQASEDNTLLIDVTEAPKPEVTRFTMPQGATAKITLTAEVCDDDECVIEEATAELGACSMEKNVLTFTPPADKVGDVLLTYRGRVKGGPPQVREIIVTLTEAEATLEPTTLDFTTNTAMIYTSLSRAKTTSSRTSTAGEAKHDGAMNYILVFSNDTQHVLGMNDHGHRGLEMVAHLPITNIETNAETGNVQMSFADEAGLNAAVAWAKARRIEELPKHVERECTHAFCEHTRLSAEAQTRVEVEEAEAIAAGRTGAAKKNATKKVNHLKSRRVSMSAMSFSVNRAVEREEATERAAAVIVARTMYTHLTVSRPPRAPASDSESKFDQDGTEHPGDRHRLWITKDTQHFCDMENHDHAHESKPPPLRLALKHHIYRPPHVAPRKCIACFAAPSSSHTTPPPARAWSHTRT